MWNKILTFSKITLFSIIMISCSMDFNLRDGNEISYKGSDSWMSKVEDTKLIREMTIPGTHDTCANHDFLFLSSTAAAQDLTLREQLEAGVRQIDIRLYYNGSTCLIHHGITYQHMDFSQVLSICYNFLDKHPTETIIFLIKSEWKCSDSDIIPFVQRAITHKNSNNEDRWKLVDSAETLTLGDCRGKCVLVKRFKGMNGIGIPSGNGYYGLKQADDYKTNNIPQYWTDLQAHINEQKNTSPVPFTVVWSSGYFEGQFGIPNIRCVSSAINPKLESYLDSNNLQYSQAHLGMIGTDHITRRLAYKIYRVNFSSSAQDESLN